jgi:hypothetical protein
MKWGEETCAYAADKGHLEVLQWLRSEGCPWDERTCMFAATGGHLETLQWARAHGCPWNDELLHFAVVHGHTHVIQWAQRNGWTGVVREVDDTIAVRESQLLCCMGGEDEPHFCFYDEYFAKRKGVGRTRLF